MLYKITEEILYQLGINKSYKGYNYIVSSIEFIYFNEYSFSPVTKVLYVEIAKQYNTSGICVEKSIRDVIRTIWSKETDKKLIYEIFGKYILSRRPSNMEFLMLLHKYIKNDIEQNYAGDQNKLFFRCPISGKPCDLFCHYMTDMLRETN